MMSAHSTNYCSYCKKECKSSDSRPYPSSKSKERIHNRCYIRTNIKDKKQSNNEINSHDTPSTQSNPICTAPSIMERMAKEFSDINDATKAQKLAKLIDEKTKDSASTNSDNSSQFFFDLKAGIAKPHEKRRCLHHRNLSEMVARYDDNGFQQEPAGRAYDHTGKDLNTLGNSDDDTSQLEEETNNSKKRSGKRSRDEDRSRSTKVKLDEQNPCWFCLSSPKVEKHLIIAIGDFCYITLAKGGLNEEHLLLIPINHVQCLNDSNSVELLSEVEGFKRSLVDYFTEKAMGVVFFERNFRSVHWQLQIVPIPVAIFDGIEEKIKLVSKSHFQNSSYHDIPKNCSLSDIIKPGAPYFFWQIEPSESRFVTEIQVQGSFFPVQFGRLVLSDKSILDCPSKVDWRKCMKTEEEYKIMVRQFKSSYKEPF